MGTTEAALKLLGRAKTAAEVRAAIDAAAPGPRLRAAIVDRYDEISATPRRDPAAYLRAELLRGLRSLVTVADRRRLDLALVTYEFGPQGENCAGLRTAALLGLAELDPGMAEMHAVHLLGDGYTDPMSGEPAVTAVRFLGARGAVQPVYLYALSGGARHEILAEALRTLAGLPAPLVVELAARLRKSDDDIALVGLFDLLTAHDEPAAFAAFVRDWALETDRLDVLNFAAAQVIAKRRAPLVDALHEAAALTVDRGRKSLLREALSR